MTTKIAFFFCILSLVALAWTTHSTKSSAGFKNEVFVLESVIRAHNLNSDIVYNLMEQHGLDESSLLSLLTEVGQSAAAALRIKDN